MDHDVIVNKSFQGFNNVEYVQKNTNVLNEIKKLLKKLNVYSVTLHCTDDRKYHIKELPKL